MTTSITDARFTHLHATNGYISALLTDKYADDDPDPWSVMPGYDENLPIPPGLDPPRLDHDDTLPSQIHPSYPYGRPSRTMVDKKGKPGNFLGHEVRNEKWDELNLAGLLEHADGREVPPVMAGSKRPPSPPSPQMRPYTAHEPRSQHLRRHLERQQLAAPAPPADQFDAPVPNETYADEGERPQQQVTPQ